MSYNPNNPKDTEFFLLAPALLRENFEGLRTDQIVDAGSLKGYVPGNLNGNIPISNGTLNINLNAEMLNGNYASTFALKTDLHSHANKALLDTYNQTEINLADAVNKKHSHSNKTLLDSYNQTNTDITDAVSKRHVRSHSLLSADDHPVTGLTSGQVLKATGDSIIEFAKLNTDEIIEGNNLFFTSDRVNALITKEKIETELTGNIESHNHTITSNAINLDEQFLSGLSNYTKHEATAGAISIVNGELRINEYSNYYAHIHCNADYITNDKFIVQAKIKVGEDSGVSWCPHVIIHWDSSNWIGFGNRYNCSNLNCKHGLNGVYEENTGKVANGVTEYVGYRIIVTLKSIICQYNKDGTWLTFRIYNRPADTIGVVPAIAFGKGHAIIGSELEWNNNYANAGTLGLSYIDDIVISNLDDSSISDETISGDKLAVDPKGLEKVSGGLIRRSDDNIRIEGIGSFEVASRSWSEFQNCSLASWLSYTGTTPSLGISGTETAFEGYCRTDTSYNQLGVYGWAGANNSAATAIGVRGYATFGSSFLNCIGVLGECVTGSSGYPGVFQCSSVSGNRGKTISQQGFATATADFGELMESLDGNHIPLGTSVIEVPGTGKIRPALEGEIPIGVTSGTCGYVGNAAELEWHDRYLTDEFGQILTEEKEVDIGDGTLAVHTVPIENPNYDSTLPYIPRANRPEWSVVGLLGIIHLRKGQPTDPRWRKLKDISDNVELWLIK